MTSEMEENMNTIENEVVGRSIKTKILEKINSGSYGHIHNGIFLNTGEKVAVKVEKSKTPHPQLLSEGNIMRHLEGGEGIPKIFWFGSYEPHYNCMVLDLLGPNLQELFSYCDHEFSLKTTLLIADQVLATFNFMHKREYIHRDIKPDNFAIGPIGSSSENKIFLFDFGLSKKFHRKRYSLISMSPTSLGSPIVGTVRYAGVNNHELPRDDLEAFLYCLVYFLKGHLPWQGIKDCTTHEEKLLKIKYLKSSIAPEVLCSDLPQIFTDLVQTCRAPRSIHDTSFCALKWKNLFRDVASEMGIKYDEGYDWVEKREITGVDYPVALPDHGHDSS